MATSVLKEFLISIGFKVDDVSEKKYQAGVKRAQDIVESLGAATVAVAALIDRNVLRIAESYDKLYYASQRIGSTVTNIQSVQYAAKMFGVSAEGITGALEGMARAQRLNPGLNGLLGRMGINPQGQDQADTMIQLLERLQKMPAFVSAQYGSMFGIDPDTLNQLLKNLPEIEKARKERLSMFQDAGLNPDRLAQQSAEFTRQMVRFEAETEILRALIAERFLPPIEGLVQGLTRVVAFIDRLDRQTGGASTYAGALGAVGLTAAGGYFGKQWLFKSILPSIGRSLGLAGAGAAEGAGAGVGAGVAAETAGVGLAGEGTAALAAVALPVVTAVLVGLGLAWLLKATGVADRLQSWGEEHPLNMTTINRWSDAARDKIDHALGTGAADVKQWASAGLEAFAKHWESYQGDPYAAPEQRGGPGRTIGYGHVIRPGEHFGHLSEAEASALLNKDMGWAKRSVAMLTRGLNLNQGQMDALADFQFGYGRLGSSNLLKLVRAGKVDAAAKEFEKYDVFHDSAGNVHHSRGLMNRRLGEEAMFRGGPQVTQHNTINVHGAKDPHATGRAVGREMRQVNADLVRNVQGTPA